MTDQRIISLQVGRPIELSNDRGRPYRTAITKTRVEGPCWLGAQNLTGDEQADLAVHGGPDKAVCVYPAAHLPLWQAALGRDDVGPGAFGENLTVEGATEGEVSVGDVYAIGEALVQISQPRAPCWKLARRWHCKTLAVDVQRTGRTGWYLRVLQEGNVTAGDSLRLVQRPHPDLTVAAVNTGRWHDPGDLDLARALVVCEALADGWRAHFRKRLDGRTEPDHSHRLDCQTPDATT